MKLKPLAWLVIVCLMFWAFAGVCFAEDKVMVQVRFKEAITVQGRGNPIEFSDAFYFTPEEWAGMKAEDWAAKKKERTDGWKYQLENPPVPVEPTKEEMEAEILQLEEQKVSLDERKAELTAKIATMTEVPKEEVR